MYPHEHHQHQGWWRSRATWVLLAFAAIALFFLITEHTAHLLGALPFLLLLLCPLLMLFMQGRHGEHGGQQSMQSDHQQTTTRYRDDETEGGTS